MKNCFYCDAEQTGFVRYSEAACEKCFQEEFNMIANPAIVLSEKDKAKRHRILIRTFSDLFGER